MATKKLGTKTEEVSLKDILRGQSSRWLTEDEKEEMSDDKSPFTITAIEKTKDAKYGMRWELTVDIDGEERGLTIPTHKARDGAIQGLAEYVKKNGSVGPLRLKVKPFGKDGHTWISLHAAKK